MNDGASAHAGPAQLRARIAADIDPVTPLAPPARRALAIVPLAILLLAGSVWTLGLRRDAPALGLALTWGASALEAALGLLLTVAALRESVPGLALTRRTTALSFGAAALAVASITWATWASSRTRVPPPYAGEVWRNLFCRDRTHRAAGAGGLGVAHVARLSAPPPPRRQPVWAWRRPPRRRRVAPLLPLLRSRARRPGARGGGCGHHGSRGGRGRCTAGVGD